ncbi:MAG: TIM barrel protein [Candidatus Helarchaeota archaeon]
MSKKNISNLRIGPAGIISDNFKDDYLKILQICKNKSYSALEIEFLNINKFELYPSYEIISILKSLANKYNVKLSIHAPYFINLGSQNPNTIRYSINHLIKSLKLAHIFQGNVVCHVGFYQSNKPKSITTVINSLKKLKSSLEINNELELSNLFLETPGKYSVIGIFDELILIAKECECSICIDWAHLYAKNPASINPTNINHLITRISDELGKNYFHMHISGIMRNKNGEVKHIPFRKSFFPVEVVINTLKELGISGTLICESPERYKNDTNYLLSIYKTGKLPFPKLKTIDEFFKK